MATASHDSSLQVLRLPAGGGAADRGGKATGTAAGDDSPPGLWLDGDVLACACPECHGPMSIRLWLMVADCWRCGTSIELTEQQEREALRLLEARGQPAPAPTSPPRSVPDKSVAGSMPAGTKQPKARRGIAVEPKRGSTAASTAPKAPDQPPQARSEPPSTPTPPQPRKGIPVSAVPTRRVPAAQRPVATVEAVEAQTLAGSLRSLAHDLLRNLPAWLISLLFHVVVMMLLGLWVIRPSPEDDRRPMLIVATLGDPDREGGQKQQDEHPDAAVIEDPGPQQTDNPNEQQDEIESPEGSHELGIVSEADAGHLPSIEVLKRSVAGPPRERMFEGRDPRIRTQVVEREGGTRYTEAAVVEGLRWLSRHQSGDGSWRLHAFHRAGDCDGRCGGRGQESDVGGTAMALLPFLGAGQTHRVGIYKDTVERGLRFLLNEQRGNGDLRGRGIGRMYAHGLATITLCEAYALTGDPDLRHPAQQAINFIVNAQHSAGGWRYSPGEAGDTSVVGWQLMALRSGQMAGLDVPQHCFGQADRFLDSVQSGRLGGLYAYQRGRPATPAMTAEGLLCRQYIGWSQHHPGLLEGADYLLDEHLPNKNRPNIYYWYYATQMFHHLGGQRWERWNLAMREALIELQEKDGHERGSWAPQGGAIGTHDTRAGGRIYMTALAICTLEVYYRHLPLYRSIELE